MAHTKITRPTSHSMRAPRRRKRSWGRWLTTLVVAVASLLVIGGAAAAVLVYFVHSTLPEVSALYQPPSQATRIFAANGELIASLFQENREFVPLREVPDVLRKAVIAIED
ncbi:MAG: hypothetical protein FJX78_10910, partial [Armatimonadetes bacterium]|nr:hypothetical protein [Armatimonadota bacterium]